jgi:segregation and condensation protein A
VRRHGTTTFRALVAGEDEAAVVVARFLALLELFREGLVGFDQVTPLGELTVRWTGDDDAPEPALSGVGSEFDEADLTADPSDVEEVPA